MYLRTLSTKLEGLKQFETQLSHSFCYRESPSNRPVKLPNHVSYYSNLFHRVSLSDSVLPRVLLGSASTAVGAPVKDTIYTYWIHPASPSTLYLPLTLCPIPNYYLCTSLLIQRNTFLFAPYLLSHLPGGGGQSHFCPMV